MENNAIASEYRTLKDLVYEYIASNVSKGTFDTNGKIVEQQVSDALGVSRTPVREALIQLASEGYLESIPRRGFFVNRLTEQMACDVVNILGPLDGRAAFLAMPNMTDDDVAKMQFLQGSIGLAIDQGLFRMHDKLQKDFHECYYAKCPNKKLIDYIRQLNRYFSRREVDNLSEDDLVANLRKANEEHAEIVRLFKARDAVGVQDYIRDVHWDVSVARTFVW